jgi:hypothetical protein
MTRNLAYFSLLFILMATLLTPGLAKAQDASTVFNKYSNPHAVCEYYRSNGYAVDRETDNECLTSLGEGQYKTYTQYYYSGNQWCYKLIQQGQTYHSNCIPIPSKTKDNSTYAIVFIVVFVLFVVVVASASGAKAKKGRGNHDQDSAETTNTEQSPQNEDTSAKQRKPLRSGKGSYGWEEMETSTTEANIDQAQGPGEGESTGGVGLHQGEPIVSSTADELEKLSQLREKGVITEKEFNLAKKKLLK